MEDKKINFDFGGFGTLLGLLFIGLKLGKVIDWSWVWVLAPIWISWGITIIILIITLLILALANKRW